MKFILAVCHIWVASTTFKQLLNLEKKMEKIEINLHAHLGLAESFKAMNRPVPNQSDPARPEIFEILWLYRKDLARIYQNIYPIPNSKIILK